MGASIIPAGGKEFRARSLFSMSIGLWHKNGESQYKLFPWPKPLPWVRAALFGVATLLLDHAALLLY